MSTSTDELMVPGLSLSQANIGHGAGILNPPQSHCLRPSTFLVSRATFYRPPLQSNSWSKTGGAGHPVK